MKRIGNFFKGCWQQLKMVSWPSKELVLHFTWIIILSTLVFAIVLGLVDTLLGLLLDLIF